MRTRIQVQIICLRCQHRMGLSLVFCLFLVYFSLFRSRLSIFLEVSLQVPFNTSIMTRSHLASSGTIFSFGLRLSLRLKEWIFFRMGYVRFLLSSFVHFYVLVIFYCLFWICTIFNCIERVGATSYCVLISCFSFMSSSCLAL